jgi:hypothetical protein
MIIGLANPSDPSLPRVGALACLIDYRDGTNLTGLNPEHKKWIRHIGMICHENPSSVMYAMRKDKGNVIEGLLADGVFYGKRQQYGGEWITTVGQPGKVSNEDFLHYSLSARSVSAAVVGIGETDPNNDPERDQFVADLAACQTAGPLSLRERRGIEDRVAALHGIQTNFFQRPGSGLQPPQNVRVGRTTARLDYHFCLVVSAQYRESLGISCHKG